MNALFLITHTVVSSALEKKMMKSKAVYKAGTKDTVKPKIQIILRGMSLILIHIREYRLRLMMSNLETKRFHTGFCIRCFSLGLTFTKLTQTLEPALLCFL